MSIASGWANMGWYSWTDLSAVRARLDAGANPNGEPGEWTPLHDAAERGTPEVVVELAQITSNVDSVYDGRTPLWNAVQADRADNARVLLDAGADPWLSMMDGWSPARLSLVTKTPDLFDAPASLLTAEERAAVTEAPRLIEAVSDIYGEGLSVCCVSGIDAQEAVRRLQATVFVPEEGEIDDEYGYDIDDGSLEILGITTVPGGTIVCQPWAFGASRPVVSLLLSAGTHCYAMYANPKSGNQGSLVRDGAIVGWDLHPGGGWSREGDDASEILRMYLYRGHALAYCCAAAGVAPQNNRPFAYEPDLWARLPSRDYWSTTL